MGWRSLRWNRARPAVAALVGLLASLPACTTVSRTALGGSGMSGGSVGVGSSAAPGGTGGSGAQASLGSSGTVTGGAGAGPGGGLTSGSAAAVASGGQGGGGPLPGASGASSTAACKQGPVKIGATYSSDEGQALAAFGAGPNAAEDAQLATNYQAYAAQNYGTMASWINAHGGLGPGCPVSLGWHDFHILGADGFSGETQTECADFAEDQHVQIVINTVEETGALIPCLAQHHVVDFFDSSIYTPSPTDYAKYQGYLYELGGGLTGMSTYRWGPFISLFNQSGYFGKGAKVGILLADDGSGHNQDLVNKLWAPALEALGFGKPSVFTYTEGNGSSASIGQESQQFSTAVLQFRAAGVNHVLFTPDGGNAVFLFPPQANSQQFYPRYGMTTANGISLWSVATPSEQANAMAISYAPFDTAANGQAGNPDFSQYNTNPHTATETLCNQIYAGHIPSGEYVQDMYSICDQFLLLQQALHGASVVTPATLLAGVNRLGRSFVTAGLYANAAFGAPDHYDGATGVRVMLWHTSNTSWDYVSPVGDIPWVS